MSPHQILKCRKKKTLLLSEEVDVRKGEKETERVREREVERGRERDIVRMKEKYR